MKSNKTKSAMTALVIAAMICTAAMPVKAEESKWVNDDGKWSLIKADGKKATGWVKDGECWYAFDENGSMRTGWVASHEHWYFMGESGVMQVNTLVEDNGAKYFVKGTGVMAKDYVKDGYEFTSDGKAIPLSESKSVVLTDAAELEGKVIEGNLYVDVTTAKEIELKGVTVKGKLIIIGDNETEGKLTLTDSTVETINTQSRNSEVVLSGDTEVKNIVIEETAKITTDKDYKGKVENFEIQSTTKGTVVIEVPAENVSTNSYATVDVQAPVENLEVRTETEVKVNSDVKNVTVAETAKDTTVEVGKGSTVGTITADAPVKIDGEGTVEKVEANVDGVEAGKDTTIKEVETGKDVTEAPDVTKPDNGGSSGGSDSGSSTITTKTVSTEDELVAALTNTSLNTVTLSNNITLTKAENQIVIPANQNVTLNLAGHKITSDIQSTATADIEDNKVVSGTIEDKNLYIFDVKGKLTLNAGTNGGVNSEKTLRLFYVDKTGTLTINGGTYKSTANIKVVTPNAESDTNKNLNEKSYNYFVSSYGKVTINNVEAETDYGIAVWGNKADLTLNDSNIKSTLIAVAANGIKTNEGYKITIDGGSIKCDDTAIYMPSYGEVTIRNASIEGTKEGIEVRAGKLTVNGGTIAANHASSSEIGWNNGATGSLVGALIIGKTPSTSDISYNGNIDVSITNTEIKNSYSGNNEDVIVFDSRYSNAADKVTVNIDSSCTITGKVIRVDNAGKTAWEINNGAYTDESNSFEQNIEEAIKKINLTTFANGTISQEGNGFIVILNANNINTVSGTGFMDAAMYLQNKYYYKYIDSKSNSKEANQLLVTIAGEKVDLKSASKESIINLLKNKKIINEDGTISPTKITVTFTHKSIPNSTKTYTITFNEVVSEIVLLNNDTTFEDEVNQKKEENNDTPLEDKDNQEEIEKNETPTEDENNGLPKEEESLNKNTNDETNPSEE